MSTFSILCLVLLFLWGCAQQAVKAETLSESQRQDLPKESEHFVMWEKCETRFDTQSNKSRECCRGNYKCTSPKCRNSRICQLGIFRQFTWCFHDTCFGLVSSSVDPPNSDHDKDIKATKSPSPNPTTSVENETETATPSPTPMSPSPSPTESVSLRSRVLCSGERRVRQDIRDLSDEQLKVFHNGILRLNEAGKWDELTEMHHEMSDSAHGGVYFLPWHRLQLNLMESYIREYMNSSDFGLPFWDWSSMDESQDASLSTIWGGKYMGGSEIPPESPILSGPFEGFSVQFPGAHTVKRNFTSGVSGQLPVFWNWHALANLIDLPEGNWEEFNDGIEAAHALIHLYVGGDMRNTMTAPNDPLFYVHHAFVDSLMQMRLERNGAGEFSGTHDFSSGSRVANSRTKMAPFDVSVRKALDLECIEYIPYSGNPDMVGHPQMESEEEEDEKVDENYCNELSSEAESGDGLSAERCLHGASALRGNQTK